MKEILKLLEKIYRTSGGNVFADWVNLMFFALTNQEKEYLQLMEKYSNDGEVGKRDIDYFGETFGLLILEMRKEQKELLGQLYEEMASKYGKKQLGQFFTPHNICKLMVESVNNVKEGQSVMDPACGSGRLLTTYAQKQPLAKFYGIDLDVTCARMAALNMCFHNVNAIIIHGNALTIEIFSVYKTRWTLLGGELYELKDIENYKPVMEALDKQQKQSIKQHEQLALL